MTAASADTPPEGPVESLEVRWILSGPLGTAMQEWFARFPIGTQARQDTYLLQPRLPGLSVKLRDGASLDVKSYLGSPGILSPARRSPARRGRLESWRKWSFPYDAAPPSDSSSPGVSDGWVVVSKRRRGIWFPLATGQNPAPVPKPVAQTGCAVELTEVDVHGEPWWTMGFEATGSAGLLHSALEHAADQIFAQPLPPGVDFSLGNSRSYTQWLTQWLAS